MAALRYRYEHDAGAGYRSNKADFPAAVAAHQEFGALLSRDALAW